MAKDVKKARQKKVDLDNLSQKDVDILKMDTKEVMAKYALSKQPVYDRRFALKKKIEAAGLSIEQIAVGSSSQEGEARKTMGRKEVFKKKTKEQTALGKESQPIQNFPSSIVDKQIPIILRPIEINFDNFSLKVNGVPKKISVNPDTNVIEIDL